jgi:hypothetical protein
MQQKLGTGHVFSLSMFACAAWLAFAPAAIAKQTGWLEAYPLVAVGGETTLIACKNYVGTDTLVIQQVNGRSNQVEGAIQLNVVVLEPQLPADIYYWPMLPDASNFFVYVHEITNIYVQAGDQVCVRALAPGGLTKGAAIDVTLSGETDTKLAPPSPQQPLNPQ